MPKKNYYSGFGVETRQGRLLWQYSRPTEAETREAYLRNNPQVEGHEDGHIIVKVSKSTVPLEKTE